MTAFSERRAALLTYCRLEELLPEDEALLESCYEDAISYMTQAGVTEPVSGPRLAQYNTCVSALVLDAWDQRGSQIGDKTLAENPAFRRRLNQLKLTEPISAPSESDERGG